MKAGGLWLWFGLEREGGFQVGPCFWVIHASCSLRGQASAQEAGALSGVPEP